MGVGLPITQKGDFSPRTVFVAWHWRRKHRPKNKNGVSLKPGKGRGATSCRSFAKLIAATVIGADIDGGHF